jgi:hypothetical protein
MIDEVLPVTTVPVMISAVSNITREGSMCGAADLNVVTPRFP